MKALPAMRGITDDEVCAGTPATIHFGWKGHVWPDLTTDAQSPRPATVVDVAHDDVTGEVIQVRARDEVDGTIYYFTVQHGPVARDVRDRERDEWFSVISSRIKLIIGVRYQPRDKDAAPPP